MSEGLPSTGSRNDYAEAVQASLSLAVGALMVGSFAACDPPTPERATSGLVPAAPAFAPLGSPWRRPLAAPVAFDLRWTRHGAFIAWAEPDGGRHALRGMRIDASGRPGATVTFEQTDADVVEVALGYDPQTDRLGVAWIQRRTGEQPALRGTSGDGEGAHFEPAAALGPTRVDRTGVRGHLAIAAGRSPTGLRVYARGDDDACEDGRPARCASFGAHALPPESNAGDRPWLTVPRPCDRPVTGYLNRPPHFYYGVCHHRARDRRPETIWYGIQPEPMYAQAHPLLTGCDPRGTAVLGDAVWVTAACDGRRTGVRVRALDVSPPVSLDARTLRCGPTGRPVLRLDRAYPLVAPADRLAPVLPAVLAPVDAAAVWTGDVLLVARHAARRVEVSRYRCAGDQFVRDG